MTQAGSATAEQLGTPWESFAWACMREPVELRGMEVPALSCKILDVIYTHKMNFWINGEFPVHFNLKIFSFGNTKLSFSLRRVK